MDEIVSRYYRLKQRLKELERELDGLRGEIVGHCTERGLSGLEAGGCRVKLVCQERREYDDVKLYEALPDPSVWRLLSRADGAKVASLVRLGVIPEERLRGTYTVKRVTLLQIDKI